MLKKLIVSLIIMLLLLFAVAAVIKSNERLRNKFLSDLRFFISAFGLDNVCLRIEGIGNKLRQKPDLPEPKTSGDAVALYFKDGSVMIGELISKTENEYIINWKGEETVVFAGQVERMDNARSALKDRGALSDEEISEWWPYDNDIVIRLTNRAVLDADIKSAGKESVTLQYLLDKGGAAEQDIERARIEYLIFKPIDNKESRKIEATLKTLFPNMSFYKMGNFTIVSDADITWVREWKHTLSGTYTNIYLEFFGLLKDRKPQIQNFVVIFDDYADFLEYAIADCVPGWAVSGYFSPDDKVLYLFNILGDRFSEVLFEGMVGESGRAINDIVDTVQAYVDERYHIFIDGQAKVIRDKFWKAYSYYKNIFRESTLSTLRHEFTHEIFYNWNLQNIVLSKSTKDNEELIKKKKEFLEAKDCRKKAELIRALMALRSQEAPLDMRAANSWLAEGIATYCETNPVGSQNDRWLFIYQEMAREQSVYPIESFTVYKMGSFPGVCSLSMSRLYSQSWAFVSFLMDKYPEQFMEYQKKMAEKTAQDYEDIAWLLEYIGKDLRTLDKEFVEYMSKFEKLEDPFVRHFERLYNIFNE